MHPSNYPFRRLVLAFVTLMLVAGNAHAFGNTCRNVNFSVDNENDYGFLVTRLELWSASEGRWLGDDIPNITVPGGAKDFVIRRGENVEHAENDRITQIRVHYQYNYYPPGRCIRNTPKGVHGQARLDRYDDHRLSLRRR